MKIYLMQHGKPLSKEGDPDRPLSDQGKKDVEKIAGFLQKYGLGVENIFHSGKTRARQTAEIMGSRLTPRVKPKKKDGLSPLDDVKEMANLIEMSERDLLIAGHLPHLAKLASSLILGDESIPVVGFRQGGVVCLERGEGGGWAIAWMVLPELIK
jgi:phosphohistidine phosphatase